MEIVLNEITWAENAIKEKSIGKKPSETLGRVAKYYIYHEHMSQHEARAELEKFLLSCDRSISAVVWGKTLDNAIRYAIKYKPINIGEITVTDRELSVIDSLSGVQLRRLAFTLLCVAKYANEVNGDIDYWVNTPDKDIMRMANINTSIRRQSMMYGQLRDIGLIRFSKRVDNLSVQVLFASDDGGIGMTVRDFRNLGFRYMMRNSKQYYECECCGLVCKEREGKTSGRKKKYCAECSVRIKTQQSVNSVMNRKKYINGADNPYVVYMHEFPNGKKYVGMTKQPLVRRWCNGHGYDDQSDISLAIATFGWDNVEHYMLCSDLTREQAVVEMMRAIELYKTYDPNHGYNKMAFQNIAEKTIDYAEEIGSAQHTPVRLDSHGRVAS